jgi:protein SCO1/2
MNKFIFLMAWLASACQAAVPGWDQHLGARLPLDVRLVDEGGSAPLGRYLGQRVAVLVFGYFSCPNLCSANMQDVLAAASAAGFPPDRFRLLMVSIDPAEDAQVVARKRIAYRQRLAGSGIELSLLTGSQQAITRLASVAGFRFERDAQRGIMHPSGFLVAGPDGAISRYFLGAHVEPRDLRLALVQAAGGETGSVSDRIALVCSHFDPTPGRYTGMAMALVRAAGVLALAMVAVVVLVSRRRGRRNA